MADHFKSSVFGWVGDAQDELRQLMEKAKAGEDAALKEAKEHIEEAMRKLEFALDEEDLDDE